MKKGISPLIAAVILIAFVIAVAGIASGFFTGFIKQRQAEIEEKGETAVDCAVANFEVDEDTVVVEDNISDNTDTSNISLTTFIKGDSDLKNFRFTVYQGTDTDLYKTNDVGTVSPGDAVSLYNNSGPANGSKITKIKVHTAECSEVTEMVNNTDYGIDYGSGLIQNSTWEKIY